MLLRKLIHYVQEQSWTAIAIDFFIVVLGVFVGMQVTHWNESRLEAQRAQGYVLRIRVDRDSCLALPDLLPDLRFRITTRESGIDILGGIRSSVQALAEQVTQDLRT